MATQYKNNGPKYTTSTKYEAERTSGTLESGREYKITDWEAQEKLRDSTTIETGETANLKTINGQSLLGSGNISTSTSLPDWAGVPFNSNGRPTLQTIGDGTYDIMFIGTSSGVTELYTLGSFVIHTDTTNPKPWTSYSTRGPMVKIKSETTTYFMLEYNASGRLFVYKVDVSTGSETDDTPYGGTGETVSTKLFYRKTN